MIPFTPGRKVKLKGPVGEHPSSFHWCQMQGLLGEHLSAPSTATWLHGGAVLWASFLAGLSQVLRSLLCGLQGALPHAALGSLQVGLFMLLPSFHFSCCFSVPTSLKPLTWQIPPLQTISLPTEKLRSGWHPHGAEVTSGFKVSWTPGRAAGHQPSVELPSSCSPLGFGPSCSGAHVPRGQGQGHCCTRSSH